MGNYAGTGSQSLGNSPQPVAIMERTANNKNYGWQLNGNVFAEVDFLKHFTARTSFGGTIDNFFNNTFVFTAYENAENAQNPNSYIENYGWNTSWTWTNTLKYTNTFFAKHSLTLLVGSEAIKNSGRAVGASRGSYYITDPTNLTVDPNLWTLNFGSPAGQTNGNIISNNGIQTPYLFKIYSLFGRLDYSFDDKYLLSGTLRRDGASVFAQDQRFGVFPSVTAGWRISRESFMKDIAWINDLKIRGGWGKLGSISNINPTNAYTLFSQSAALSYYDINGTSTTPTQGVFASQLGNIKTTWEEDKVTNVGFDATILKNKLDLTLEWYKKSISGLLFPVGLPATAGGATPPFINSGDIQNSGIDAALTYHGAIKRDFKFDITVNFTSYDNKVISLPPGVQYFEYGGQGSPTTFSRVQPGHPLGAYFGYKVLGIFQNADEVAKAPVQDGAAPGRFRYADVNGDGMIDNNDRTFFGDPNPKWSAGLNIGASYKGFDFFIFIYTSQGNDVLNLVRTSTDFPQQFDAAMSKDVALHSWRPDRPDAKVPMLERIANFSNALAFNSYFNENGSFIRCKTLTLGYTIPAAKLNRFGIDRFRIYVQAVNLFTITKYTGLDPELPGGGASASVLFGLDGGAYPANQKGYNVGVNLTFQ
jgi:TonB-linked SusC/RagA family outer membrane protein